MFLKKKFLSSSFFNFLGREFQNIIPLYVKKFRFKFVETVGREKPSDEDCLVLCLCKLFVFTNSCSRGNVSRFWLTSNIALAVSST